MRGVFRNFLFFVVLIWGLFWGAPSRSYAAVSVSPEELRAGIFQNMEKVPEFVALREIERQHGVKFYLFGGTASSWADYQYWFKRYEKKDPEVFPHRLDHAFGSIYSDLEDVDLVVKADGKSDAALADIHRQLEALFRGRRVDMHLWNRDWFDAKGKPRISPISNPEFKKQNQDSLSTTLIEVGGGNQILNLDRVEDLRFLDHIVRRIIEFNENPAHKTTERFKSGENPEIIGAIRFLVKVNRYGLNFSDADRAKIKRMIDQFDAEDLVPGSYVSDWISNNAPKLLAYVLSLEKASDLLDSFQLKSKLLQLPAFSPRGNKIENLFIREPLRSGKQAEVHMSTWPGDPEGLPKAEVVTHETSPEAARRMTWSMLGILGAFISAQKPGHGTSQKADGFYAVIGDSGAGHAGHGSHIQLQITDAGRESGFLQFDRNHVVIGSGDAVRLRRQEPKNQEMVVLDFLRNQFHSDNPSAPIWISAFLKPELFDFLRSDPALLVEALPDRTNEPLLESLRPAFFDEDGQLGKAFIAATTDRKDIARFPRLLKLIPSKDVAANREKLIPMVETWFSELASLDRSETRLKPHDYLRIWRFFRGSIEHEKYADMFRYSLRNEKEAFYDAILDMGLLTAEFGALKRELQLPDQELAARAFERLRAKEERDLLAEWQNMKEYLADGSFSVAVKAEFDRWTLEAVWKSVFSKMTLSQVEAFLELAKILHGSDDILSGLELWTIEKPNVREELNRKTSKVTYPNTSARLDLHQAKRKRALVLNITTVLQKQLGRVDFTEYLHELISVFGHKLVSAACLDVVARAVHLLNIGPKLDFFVSIFPEWNKDPVFTLMIDRWVLTEELEITKEFLFNPQATHMFSFVKAQLERNISAKSLNSHTDRLGSGDLDRINQTLTLIEQTMGKKAAAGYFLLAVDFVFVFGHEPRSMAGWLRRFRVLEGSPIFWNAVRFRVKDEDIPTNARRGTGAACVSWLMSLSARHP